MNYRTHIIISTQSNIFTTFLESFEINKLIFSSTLRTNIMDEDLK